VGLRLERAVLSLLRAPTVDLTVLDVREPWPGFRRIRFAAPELIGRVSLHPGIWLRLWLPSGESVVQRGYTITQVDLDEQTFAVDFVLHQPEGVATAWARRATVGDQLEATLYAGAPFAFADSRPPGYLLVGDTASLPAINEIIRAATDLLTLQVLLVAAHDHDRAAQVAGNSAADVQVNWVDATNTDTAGAVLGAINQLGDLAGWHFWIALEQAATKQVRAEIKARWSPGRHELKAQAYWVRGRSMGTVVKDAASSNESH